MNQKLLGIDYGLTNIGLSFANTPLAEPLNTISATSALDAIPLLVGQHQIDAIIIGLSEGAMADQTRQFAAKLKTVVSLPIYFQDETLSSQESQAKLVAGTARRSARREPTDHFAATQILQEFIDIHLPLEKLPPVDPN